jgi:DNA ligase 4
MGFKFPYLCDLLSELEANRILKASTSARSKDVDARTVINWFNNHEKRIYDESTDLLALLSCLFPEKRTDRVYWLQDTSLARVIARCLLLGTSRREELDRWRVSGGEDLGQCVENVMCQAENHIPPGQEVETEEIDAALNRIASRCRFSGPKVRKQHAAVDVEEALGNLYRRLRSRDAKWLTRMILKSFAPVELPANIVLRNFHFLLPHLLLFQDCFDGAINQLISTPLGRFPPRPEPGAALTLSAKALEHLAPRIGVKVGRPEYYKARSIKHCCRMAGRRTMSLERKYDGEYCQIHINLSKAWDWVQIFSKSGKDSTADRVGIRDVLKDALRIGRPDCKFSRHCILEGELLAWSDKDKKILGFHKLRKFIARSGTFIGTDHDSQ